MCMWKTSRPAPTYLYTHTGTQAHRHTGTQAHRHTGTKVTVCSRHTGTLTGNHTRAMAHIPLFFDRVVCLFFSQFVRTQFRRHALSDLDFAVCDHYCLSHGLLDTVFRNLPCWLRTLDSLVHSSSTEVRVCILLKEGWGWPSDECMLHNAHAYTHEHCS